MTHQLTEGVTVVVTPSCRWLGLAVRRGASLDELVDELAARDTRKHPAADYPESGTDSDEIG